MVAALFCFVVITDKMCRFLVLARCVAASPDWLHPLTNAFLLPVHKQFLERFLYDIIMNLPVFIGVFLLFYSFIDTGLQCGKGIANQVKGGGINGVGSSAGA